MGGRVAIGTAAGLTRLRLARLATAAGLILLCHAVVAQDARWQQLTLSTRQLYGQGKYQQALAPAQESLRVAEATFGPQSRQEAVSLNDLALVLEALDRTQEAEPLYKRALAINEKLLGAQDPQVASTLNNLGLLYLKMKRLPEARDLLTRALAIREKALGPNHPDTATNAGNLGTVLIEQGNYAAAEPLEQRALAIDEKALGPDSPGVATDLNNLATVYYRQAKYAQAEPLYIKALSIHLKALGNEHPTVANDLSNIAELYAAERKYPLAEATFQRAIAIDEKAFGPEHPKVAIELDSLAGLYYSIGRYQDSETAYRRALAIREKALGPEHRSLAPTLSGLAQLKKQQGQLQEAEPLYKRALAIDEKALGPDDPHVARILNGLGDLYSQAVHMPEAGAFFKRALDIDEKHYPATHPQVLEDINNLAFVLDAGGQADQAAPLYERVIAMQEKASGPNSLVLAAPLLYLGSLRTRQGNFAAAEPLEKRALAIVEAAKGPDHTDTRGALLYLAITEYGWGHTPEAGAYFDRAIGSLEKEIDGSFAYMSERQRLQFLATEPGAFPMLFSFALAQQEHDASLAGKMFDGVLYQKGLIATNAATVRAKILDSGDSAAAALFDRLTAKRAQLAELSAVPTAGGDEWRKAMAQLDQEANSIETDLVKRSAALAEAKALSHVSWRDVQKSLKPDEAAVEFVRFQVHNGVAWMHSYAYAAAVLTPTGNPKLFLLGNAQKLEAEPVTAYRADVGRSRGIAIPAAKSGAEPAPNAGAGAAYVAFWKPIEAQLGSAKRVYVAADGILNQVPMGLFTDPSGTLLLERYDLRMVNSTKDLLRAPHAATGKTALIVGNPAFDLTEASQRAAVSKLSPAAVVPSGAPVAETGTASRAAERGAPLPPLPATQAEAEGIALSLKNAGWQVSLYTGNTALKEVVERARSPRVVHLATHGFFLTGAAAEAPAPGARPAGRPAVPDPMLRSGLYFAGADRTRAGERPAAGLEDGVLTALEASQLHLQGTELVVLSACETGLGQQQNGEGVFGLRRGLQEAGAQRVLMSMWPVPDRETQELMTLFYQQWLGGLDPHDALRQAQLKERETVRQRYGRDLPYYWGAFVLVGR